MVNTVFYSYILSLPFIFAMSFAEGKITFSILLSVVMSFVLIISLVKKGKIYISKNLLLYVFPSFLFLLYLFFNLLITLSFEIASISHFFSYVFTIVLFFVTPMCFYHYYREKICIKRVFYFVYLMTFFSAVYACLQFGFKNWFHFDLDIFLHWPSSEISGATFLGVFYRAKGFAPEAGHFAFFLECFIPLIYYYLFVSKFCTLNFVTKVITFFITLVSFLFTVSAAAFVIVPVAIFISCLLNFNIFYNYTRKYFFLSLIVIGVVLSVVFILKDILPIYDMVFTSTFDKLDSVSSADRLSRMNLFGELTKRADVLTLLFGYGPAATTKLGYGDTTIVLLYPLLIVELGIVGSLFFIFVLGSFLLKMFCIKSKVKFFICISFFSLIFHYVFIANYWYPFIWFLGILIFICFENDDKLV